MLENQLDERSERGFDDGEWEMPVVDSVMPQATPCEVGGWRFGIDGEE